MIIDFHSLYDRYCQDVYRFALYLCGDRAAAEEIVQETFVRAWTTPGEIRVGTMKAYLFMIARNLYRAQSRRRSRHVAMEHHLPDPRPGPAALAEVRQELRNVLEALQMLPEIDRAALLMHSQDGMPHAEIAAVLGLSVSAVKVKVHRARLKLSRLTSQPEEKP